MLACILSSFGELDFDLEDLLHKKKKEPKPGETDHELDESKNLVTNRMAKPPKFVLLAEPEPEPEPVYKPVKFKYSIHHDDDDDDHWSPPRPKYMHLEHSPPMHFPHQLHIPQHHEIDDNWWWTTTPKPKKKKKGFIPKDLNEIIGGDFMKKLIPDLGHKKK